MNKSLHIGTLSYLFSTLRVRRPATFQPAEAKRLWDRFEFVYTPKHGSWLNIAEIELHVLNGQWLNRHISSIKKIKEEVEAWQTNRNNKNRKINWQFTNKEARVKLKKLYPSIND